MKKLLNIRTIIGVLLIAYALWTPSSPKSPIDWSLITVEKPSQEIIDLVSPFSQLVTDPMDRARLAVFNQEFALRVQRYETDLQKLNDVYVLAAQKFFENSLVDKYDGLDSLTVSLIQKATGPENHNLTSDEKNLLSSYFSGLCWSLIQKR